MIIPTSTHWHHGLNDIIFKAVNNLSARKLIRKMGYAVTNYNNS